jgi:putative ABC transport system permease protein
VRAADVLRSAAGAIAGERRRTALSLLGVAVGVAAVVLPTSLGEGARRYVSQQFRSLGTDVIAVLPGKVETTGGLPGFGGVPNDLTLDDAQALRRHLREAWRIAPVCIGNDTISHGERSRQVAVFGTTHEMLAMRELELRAGTFLPDEPWERGSPVVVVGSALSRELFPGESPVGKTVRVGSWRMRVIGELGLQGVHFGIDMDQTVFVPVATAMKMFDRTSLFRLPVQVRPGTDVGATERRIVELLTQRHGEEDFTVTTPDAVMSSLGSILDALTLALVGIAAISLCVAGIGILNVMLVSVAERQSEIGLMKAVGATPRQVLALFLTEAVALSGAGGLLGLAAGLALVRAARALFPVFPAATPPWAAAAALAVSLVVGVTFGFLPARRAVRLDPVHALRKR